MPHAVIVAHGQPSDPEPAEAALADYARSVDALCPDITVVSATLAAPGQFESCLQKLPDDTVLFPLFMAKGWFVTSALPKRLDERPLRILDPLGVDPEMPNLVAQALTEALAQRQWQATETDFVLAAHGSGRSRNPSAVALHFAEALGQTLPFKSLRVGFVEEPPSISDAASKAGARAICLPFFACTGGHVLEDIPQELEKAAFQGDTLPVVGELPGIQRHIAATLSKAFLST